MATSRSNYYGALGPQSLLGSPARPNPALRENDPTDYPSVDSATGKIVSVKTGKPWNGKATHYGETFDVRNGERINPGAGSGVEVPYSGGERINPNDPNQRYRGVDIVKSPGISRAAQELLDDFNAGEKSSMRGFDDFMKENKGRYEGLIDTAYNQGKSSTDLREINSSTRGAQTRYSGRLDDISGNYEAADAAFANTARGVSDEAYKNLGLFDEAQNRMGDLARDAVTNRVNRYKLASGTPTSMGSDELAITARENARASAPIELAKANQRYNVLGQRYDIERDLANRNTARIGQFDPMIAGRQYETGTETERYLQGLKMAVANMSYDQAARYMQSLAVPFEIRQRILSGNIANLGGIGALEEGSRYRGLQDVLGATPSQPVYYNTAQPAYPSPGRGGNYFSGSPSVISPERLPIGYEGQNPALVGAGLAKPNGYQAPRTRYSPYLVPPDRLDDYINGGGGARARPSAGYTIDDDGTVTRIPNRGSRYIPAWDDISPYE